MGFKARFVERDDLHELIGEPRPRIQCGQSDRRVLGESGETRTFGERLIDLEENKAARAVVFGSLAEMERK